MLEPVVRLVAIACQLTLSLGRSSFLRVVVPATGLGALGPFVGRRRIQLREPTPRDTRESCWTFQHKMQVSCVTRTVRATVCVNPAPALLLVLGGDHGGRRIGGRVKDWVWVRSRARISSEQSTKASEHDVDGSPSRGVPGDRWRG